MADRNGYIGRAPGDSSVVVSRQIFNSTGVTTDFTFASGYTVGYLDLYLNGARLIEGPDYTATDGATISLISPTTNGDVLEGVAYKAFNLADDRVGIQSAGVLIGQAETLNFVGTGNTFAVNGTTIDISISGGGSTGAGGTWGNYDGVTGVTTTKKVKIQNDLEVTGVTTSTGGFVGALTGNVTGTTGSFSGNVSVGGTLTYEDVTNIDSVGLVTARTGIEVLADGIGIVGGGLTVTGLSTFFGGIDLPDSPAAPNARISIGDGGGGQSEDAQIYHNSTYGTVFQDSTNTGIQIWTGGTGGIKGQNGTSFIVKTDGQGVELYRTGSIRLTTTGAGVTVAGIITATGSVQVGSGQSFGSSGASAAVYYGDGSNLSGISAGGITTTASSPSANTVVTLNLGTAQHHDITLAAGITTITCTGGSMGESHSLVLTQPSSGIATVGFSTYFLFPSGSAPSMSEGSSKVDLVSFVVKQQGSSGVATALLASAGLNYQ